MALILPSKSRNIDATFLNRAMLEQNQLEKGILRMLMKGLSSAEGGAANL